ncbi:MAG TPA: hypothetical protein VGR73_07495 [Bryobacteraceae bacterium]|nr:hypothetical protein [Bryobacteraceae bacterium]
MKSRFVFALAVGSMIAGLAVGQTSAPQKPAPGATSATPTKVRRTADGHPDFSGIWTFAISIPPGGLTKVIDGKANTVRFDQSARHKAFDVKGALPWTPAPSYKPEFQEKVKYLEANESKLDSVFYCGRPGVPRIGSPRRIIQLPNEMVFLYEDISGDPYRVVPTDGRKHRPDANPSYYGDSVGHWEGDTLVVEATNFVDDFWFGENGYMHSDAMSVVERFWLDGDNNLVYQVTVSDPKVLTAPWTNFPHVIKPSDEPLAESPFCKEDDGARLLNLDHHQQR